jgi:hypothetical protein
MVRRRKVAPRNRTKLPNLRRVNLNSHRDPSKRRPPPTPSHSSCLKRHNPDRNRATLDLKDSLNMVYRVSRARNPANRASP